MFVMALKSGDGTETENILMLTEVEKQRRQQGTMAEEKKNNKYTKQEIISISDKVCLKRPVAALCCL